MKAVFFILIFLFISMPVYCQQHGASMVIAKGRMPDIANDRNNKIHIVYGSGDSILYVSATDGKNFAAPVLVAVLPKLFASGMRGPQITVADNRVVITACTANGDIYVYTKTGLQKWTKGVIINDEESAKEGLMDVSADGLHVFAVWLGVNHLKGQSLYGSSSGDGGKTWQKKVLVYTSPDSTICECCKPSVVVKHGSVYAMFRNWISGNRDLYVIQSNNGGATFGGAKKLGKGSWKLNGCPMDGGGLAVNARGEITTVWRRESMLYAATINAPEIKIGEGKSCTVETINGKNMYAWTDNGNVILMNSRREKVTLGAGSQPALKALNNNQILCVWENEKEIHAAVVDL